MTKSFIAILASLVVLLAACSDKAAGHRSGSGGAIGLGGSGGSGGATGTAGGSGGAFAGAGGAANGRGGAGGNMGGISGSTGAGGAAGAGALHVTTVTPFPAAGMSIVGLRVAVDSQDTAVVLGPTAPSATTDPGPMLTWIAPGGSTRQKAFANERTPGTMVLDGTDAIWLLGALDKPTSFGAPTVQPVTAADGLTIGYYLVKLNRDGGSIFTKAVRRPEANVGGMLLYALAFDAADNAYVAGAFFVEATDTAAGRWFMFITKFSPTGTQLVDRTFGVTDNAEPYDLAVAPNGEVVVVGYYTGTFYIVDPPLTTGKPGQNSFIATLNAADLSPNRVFTLEAGVSVNSISMTSTGAYRVAGVCKEGSVLGGITVGDATGHAVVGGSPYIAELAADTGAGAWVRVVGEKGQPFDSSTSSADRTFAAGAVEVVGTRNAFLATVGPDATLSVPLRVVGASSGVIAVSVAADRHGGVWVTGEVNSVATIGTVTIGGPGTMRYTDFLVHLEP